MLALTCFFLALAVLIHGGRELIRAHRSTCAAVLKRCKIKEPKRYA